MQGTATGNTPWHLWAVGFVSLLWNGFGANDYIQTQTGNLEYMEGMTGSMGVSPQEAMTYFQGFPDWVDAFWAFGVWGAVLGSLLLLFRSRFAVWAFGLSLLGLAGTTIYQLTTDRPDWTVGGMASIMGVLIWSFVTFLLIYSISMRRKGVLR